MTNTYTINPTINTVNSILPGSTVGGTITIGGTGSGSSGQIYTTNGTSNTFNWATPNTQFNGGNGKPVMSMPHGKDEIVLEKDATLTVKGKVVINDRDLEERLKTIEKVLMIPERDVILEKKYPKLKKLHDQYIAALGKYRTFEAIKGEDE
jgi:pyruvate carboxylase